MRKITDEDVYRYYLGDVIVGMMYNSPIPGRKDDTPSFQLYEKDGRIRWVDYGLTDQFGRDPENLVQYLRHLPLTNPAYFDAKRLIKSEVSVGMMGKPLTQLRRRPSRTAIPYIKPKDFEQFELDYWNRFSITKAELLIEDIQPISSMSWGGEGGSAHVRSTPDSPAFVYWWNRNPAAWKMYRPMEVKKNRFRQENVDGVIEGWNSMINAHNLSARKKFEILFILSSTKDRLVVKHAYNNPTVYNGINPRGERDRQDIIAQKDYLLSIADRVIILYDADDAGWTGTQVLMDLTGFEGFDVRGHLGTWTDPKGELVQTKDFSDYVDSERGNHSYSELLNLINSII